MKKKTEFNLKRIYWYEWTPKHIALFMSKLLDKKLQVVMMPTSKNTCDFIIRNIPYKKK